MAVSPAPPQLTLLPPAPLPTDAEAVFDAKAGVRLTAEEVMVAETNDALTWMNRVLIDTAGVAGNAAAAAQSAANAEEARAGAEAALDSARVVGSAVEVSAGLPALAGNAYKSLVVLPGESGVAYQYVGTKIGDVVYAPTSPGSNFLKLDGSIYAKLAYPQLAAIIGTIGNKNFAGVFTGVTNPFGTATINAVAAGKDGVMIAVCNATAGSPTAGAARSTDGGASWTPLSTSFSGANNYQCVATDGKGTWIVGSGPLGAVYRSTDNGLTWSYIVSIPVSNMTCVATDANGVWVIGGNTGARSINNGLTWSAVNGPEAGGLATDGAGVWVSVGLSGAIKRSTDNGATWTTRVSGVTTSLRGAVIDGAGAFYARASNIIITSKDAGMSWKVVSRASSDNAGMSFTVDSNGIFAVIGVGGGIDRSFDGDIWQPSLNSFGSSLVWGIAADSAGNFVAVGEAGKISRSSPAYFYDAATQFRVPKLDLGNGLTAFIKAAEAA